MSYKKFLRGGIEKKAYWTLMREGYTHVLPEIRKVLETSEDCRNILISKDSCILERKNGVKLFFDFSQAMCRAEIELVMGADPEKENMEYISRYLSEHRCRTVMDIGANAGLFSLDLYQNNRDIEYHVFEPVPSTYERLVQTAGLNEVCGANYITHNLGLSSEKGFFEFFLPAESEAASLRPVDDEFYLKRSTQLGEYTGSGEVEKVVCQVTTVDDFVRENGTGEIGFMKIDVEGNEKHVLEGARETLKRDRPLVYCELLRKHAERFGYHPNDVIRFMKEYGYGCYVIKNHRFAAVEKIDEETKETNFFFTGQFS